MYRTIIMAVSVLGLLVSSPAAWAVKPQIWTHEQLSDFTAGELKDVVVTNEGEVMLGRKTDTLYTLGEEAEAVNALVRAGDGKVYAATGPKGVIYSIDGDQVKEFARLPEKTNVFSLLFTADGKLLAGTGGGEQAKVYVIDGNGKAKIFYEPPEATYVWAMVRGPENQIYVATGTQAKLFVVQGDGTSGKLLTQIKTKPRNLLCLAFGSDGMIYGGTDEEGLVYRINPSSGSLYVMYDAKEPEISSIVIDKDGNIFAATAAAESARPGKSATEAPSGKPELMPGKTPTSRPSATSKPANGRKGEKKEKTKGESKSETKPAAESEYTKDEADEGDEDKDGTSKAAALAMALRKQLGRAVGGAGGSAAEGNAIYRIDTDGFVTEVFRESVMILAMAEANGTIYAATGNEGRLYAITPTDEKTVTLAKLQSNQATAILRMPKGELIVGTANAAMLLRLSDAYAPKGTLTSKVLDAGQIVKWGRVSWEATIPQGTKLTVATRSGNVQDEEAAAWDEWSSEMDATAPQQISSPGARFLQYRLTFESSISNATALLRRLQLPRIEENRPPRISDLKVLTLREAVKDPAGPPKIKAMAMGGLISESEASTKPDNIWIIQWKAEDANNDTMEYSVYFRELGTKRWIRKSKELKDTFDIWDSLTVPDGKYEVRVMADDRLSNPPGTQLSDARISDPITVDNTAPEVDLAVTIAEGKKEVTVTAKITDAWTPVAAAGYTVDSNEKWIPLAAQDDIFDSPSESISFTLDKLDAGEHRIALRVSDQRNNTRYVTKVITIGE